MRLIFRKYHPLHLDLHVIHFSTDFILFLAFNPCSLRFLFVIVSVITFPFLRF